MEVPEKEEVMTGFAHVWPKVSVAPAPHLVAKNITVLYVIVSPLHGGKEIVGSHAHPFNNKTENYLLTFICCS